MNNSNIKKLRMLLVGSLFLACLLTIGHRPLSADAHTLSSQQQLANKAEAIKPATDLDNDEDDAGADSRSGGALAEEGAGRSGEPLPAEPAAPEHPAHPAEPIAAPADEGSARGGDLGPVPESGGSRSSAEAEAEAEASEAAADAESRTSPVDPLATTTTVAPELSPDLDTVKPELRSGAAAAASEAESDDADGAERSGALDGDGSGESSSSESTTTTKSEDSTSEGESPTTTGRPEGSRSESLEEGGEGGDSRAALAEAGGEWEIDHDDDDSSRSGLEEDEANSRAAGDAVKPADPKDNGKSQAVGATDGAGPDDEGSSTTTTTTVAPASAGNRASDLEIQDNSDDDQEIPTVVLTIRGSRPSKKPKAAQGGSTSSPALGGGGTSTTAAPTTLGPSLVLAGNGTRFLTQNGTSAPATKSTLNDAIALVKTELHKITNTTTTRGPNSPLTGKGHHPKPVARPFFPNATTTTHAPTTAAPAKSAPVATKTSAPAKPTTLAPAKPTTLAPAKAAPANATSPDSSKRDLGVAVTKSTPKPPATTALPAKASTAAPAKSTTTKPAAASTAKPAAASTAKPAAASTAKPAIVSCPMAKKPQCSCDYKDMKDSDKLVAVVMTKKGGFKGRRINNRAFTALVSGKADGSMQNQSRSLVHNDNFVFPAGHYYFPQPIRFQALRI